MEDSYWYLKPEIWCKDCGRLLEEYVPLYHIDKKSKEWDWHNYHCECKTDN